METNLKVIKKPLLGWVKRCEQKKKRERVILWKKIRFHYSHFTSDPFQFIQNIMLHTKLGLIFCDWSKVAQKAIIFVRLQLI